MLHARKFCTYEVSYVGICSTRHTITDFHFITEWYAWEQYGQTDVLLNAIRCCCAFAIACHKIE